MVLYAVKKMAPFESFVIGSPVGFLNGCSKLSFLAESNGEAFAALIKRILETKQQDPSYPQESKTLLYIIRSRESAAPKPSSSEFASILDLNSTLSRGSIAALLAEIEGFEGKQTEPAWKAISGVILDFQWRLGVATASSHCKNLSSPYVAITFAVKGSNGQVTHHSAELSYGEFHEFLSTFREVAEVMNGM